MSLLTPDVCVVGGGSAGLVVAAGAAQLGLDVVLIERALMGGDCLNFGCVPSKALIAAARMAHAQTQRCGLRHRPGRTHGRLRQGDGSRRRRGRRHRAQ
jgi:pyruvate/2-oxoglutarate dehydrogenase complex dihydrolipoamide dehydrogenase (E3) component